MIEGLDLFGRKKKVETLVVFVVAETINKLGDDIVNI